MDERWARVEELFNAASEMTPEDRARFLGERCAGDAELRAEVESLLGCAGAGERFFGEAVEKVASQLPAEQESRVGEHIGPYVILKEIGRGGMGAVFLAMRADDAFKKQVAIKVVKRGMDTDHVLSRFRHERQILANLDHPNIARFIDGGATRDGLPYIVMEFVEGDPITRFCRNRNAPLPECLQLFLAVCDGVQHAHRNLVIHRDLKPGNMLVTRDGVPKLLDFGIAKLLDQRSRPSSNTGYLTTSAHRMMTPDYASPEQVRGDQPTVATDVYSLGIVLCELVTGKRPFVFTGVGQATLEQIICESEPNVVSAPEELESIIRMALRKEPVRRYASVEHLAEDVRRFLDGRPVLACRDTFGYRVGKFVRRNKAWAIAASLALIGLVAGFGTAVYQARRAEIQAARAERQFAQVRKLANTLLFDHYDQLRGLPGSTQVSENLLTTTLEYLDALSREPGSDPSLRIELATAYERVGDVQGRIGSANLGKPKEALASYRKAAALLEDLNKSDRNRPETLLAMSSILSKLSQSLAQEGAVEESRRLLDRRRETAERLFQMKPSENSVASLADTYAEAGENYWTNGDPRGALANYRRAHDLIETWNARRSTNWGRETLASIEIRMVRSLIHTGDLPGARRVLETENRYREEALARRPDYLPYARDLFLNYYRTGEVLGNPFGLNLGEPAEAEKFSRKARAIADRMVQADPANVQAKVDLASATWGMAVAIAPARPAEAVTLLKQAISSVEEISLRTASTLRTTSLLSSLHLALGFAQRHDAKLNEAHAALLRAESYVERAIQLAPSAYTRQIQQFILRESALVLGKTPQGIARIDQAVKLATEISAASTSSELRADLANVYAARASLTAGPDRCGWLRKSLDVWNELGITTNLGPVATRRQAELKASMRGCN